MKRSPVVDTARKLYERALPLVANDEGVHVETACALLGVVMGTALFRKHNQAAEAPEEVGLPTFSARVDADLPNIVAAIDKLAKDGGVELDVMANGEVPPEHEPLAPPVELLKKHGSELWQALSEKALSPEDRLLASIFAVLFLVRQTKAMLPPEIVSSLVMRGFAVGAKTMPPA